MIVIRPLSPFFPLPSVRRVRGNAVKDKMIGEAQTKGNIGKRLFFLLFFFPLLFPCSFDLRPFACSVFRRPAQPTDRSHPTTSLATARPPFFLFSFFFAPCRGPCRRSHEKDVFFFFFLFLRSTVVCLCFSASAKANRDGSEAMRSMTTIFFSFLFSFLLTPVRAAQGERGKEEALEMQHRIFSFFFFSFPLFPPSLLPLILLSSFFNMSR